MLCSVVLLCNRHAIAICKQHAHAASTCMLHSCPSPPHLLHLLSVALADFHRP